MVEINGSERSINFTIHTRTTVSFKTSRDNDSPDEHETNHQNNSTQPDIRRYRETKRWLDTPPPLKPTLDKTAPPAANKEKACVHLSPPSRSGDVRGSVNRPRSVTAPRLRTFPTPDRFRHLSPFSGSRVRYLDKMEHKVESGRTLTRWLFHDCSAER